MTRADDNTSTLSLGQVTGIWWGVTWRQIVIAWVVGFATCVAAVPFSSSKTPPTLGELPSPVGPIVSAVIMIVAIRQALLANYTTFSLTVLEEGSAEPGRIHTALGVRRMLKIWWATSWPLHLLAYGAMWLVSRLAWMPEMSELEPRRATCGLLLALWVAWIGLSIVFLARALRKRYSDFRLVSLRPWSQQTRDPI